MGVLHRCGASHERGVGRWETEGGEGVNWLKKTRLSVSAHLMVLPQTRADGSREQASRRREGFLCFSASQSLHASLSTVIFSNRNRVWLGSWPGKGATGGPTGKWGRERRKIKKREAAGTRLLGTGQEGGPWPWEMSLSPAT